jgi:hypothetical protein
MKKEVKLQNSGKILIINTATTEEVKVLKNCFFSILFDAPYTTSSITLTF